MSSWRRYPNQIKGNIARREVGGVHQITAIYMLGSHRPTLCLVNLNRSHDKGETLRPLAKSVVDGRVSALCPLQAVVTMTPGGGDGYGQDPYSGDQGGYSRPYRPRGSRGRGAGRGGRGRGGYGDSGHVPPVRRGRGRGARARPHDGNRRGTARGGNQRGTVSDGNKKKGNTVRGGRGRGSTAKPKRGGAQGAPPYYGYGYETSPASGSYTPQQLGGRGGRGGQKRPRSSSSTRSGFDVTCSWEGCGKKFTNVQAFRRHEDWAHFPPSEYGGRSGDVDTRPYYCGTCANPFARGDNLVVHQNRSGHKGGTRIPPPKLKDFIEEVKKEQKRRGRSQSREPAAAAGRAPTAPPASTANRFDPLAPSGYAGPEEKIERGPAKKQATEEAVRPTVRSATRSTSRGEGPVTRSQSKSSSGEREEMDTAPGSLASKETDGRVTVNTATVTATVTTATVTVASTPTAPIVSTVVSTQSATTVTYSGKGKGKGKGSSSAGVSWGHMTMGDSSLDRTQERAADRGEVAKITHERSTAAREASTRPQKEKFIETYQKFAGKGDKSFKVVKKSSITTEVDRYRTTEDYHLYWNQWKANKEEGYTREQLLAWYGAGCSPPIPLIAETDSEEEGVEPAVDWRNKEFTPGDIVVPSCVTEGHIMAEIEGTAPVDPLGRDHGSKAKAVKQKKWRATQNENRKKLRQEAAKYYLP